MSSKTPSYVQQRLRRDFLRPAYSKHEDRYLENEPSRLLTTGFQHKPGQDEECEDEGEEQEVPIFSYSNLEDEILLGKSLNTAAARKDLQEGARLHAAIIKFGLLEINIFLGSILVNLYCKCGDLDKGQHVFDELPIRNVVSWNGLVGGYAQHGQGAHALRCLKCMQQEGLSPDAVTLTCILKACSSIGAVEKGQEVHAEIVKTGLLEIDVVLGNASIDMYAKYGALSKACQILKELPVRNVVSWTVLILAHCQSGHGEDAFDCYEQMKGESLSPDAVTFSCILKACGIIGSIEKGREVFADVIRRGLFETSTVLGNAIVDMYTKCGALAEAQHVFNRLAVRDVISWNALIGGYCEKGFGEDALYCFEMMSHDDLSPDEVTLSAALKACGSIGAVEKGKEIHSLVVRYGWLGKDINVGNALVDLYTKCGALAKAQLVFKELYMRDVVSWTVLITGFSQNGHGEDALHCFEKLKCEGVLPDVVALVSIIKACGSARALNMGKELHTEIIKRGLSGKDVVLEDALVGMYAKCGGLAEAYQVFGQSPVQDVASWNALVVGFCEQGHHERAINCLECMRFEGFSPDAVTFACILKACSSTGAVEKGREIHAEIARKGLLGNNTVLGNTLINMYIMCGSCTLAPQVFEELPCRDVVSWNSLITGYCQHDCREEAINCFDRIKHEGVSPDAVTYSCVLKACGSIGAAEKGIEVHVDIVRRGFVGIDPAVGSALVDMHAKCGALLKAREVFDSLPVQDVFAWTALIGGYCEHGHGEAALESFEQMKNAGRSPDAVTFACILKVCCSLGAPDKGQMHFESISQRYGICPTLEHYTGIVELLSRAGSIDKAMTVIGKVPTSDYVPTWLAILGACRKLGNVKLGKLAFEQGLQNYEHLNL